jgi:hypothetical protein
VIPDAGSDDPVRLRHPRHLAKPSHGVGHEVNDELGQDWVEPPILERQLFGRSPLDPNAWKPIARRRHEAFRRIDRPHGVRAQPPD